MVRLYSIKSKINKSKENPATAGFFCVSILVNFKDFYNGNALSLNADEKKASKMGINTGNAHHQRLKAGTNLAKKKPYLVAKSHTENQHEHPKVTLCLNTKKNVPLSHNDAMTIIQKYDVCPTPQETSKALKQTKVHLVLIPSQQIGSALHAYILAYKGE